MCSKGLQVIPECLDGAYMSRLPVVTLIRRDQSHTRIREGNRVIHRLEKVMLELDGESARLLVDIIKPRPPPF